MFDFDFDPTKTILYYMSLTLHARPTYIIYLLVSFVVVVFLCVACFIYDLTELNCLVCMNKN
jgi:hypothetical protein